MVQGVLLCFDCADPGAVVLDAMRRIMDEPETPTPVDSPTAALARFCRRGPFCASWRRLGLTHAPQTAGDGPEAGRRLRSRLLARPWQLPRSGRLLEPSGPARAASRAAPDIAPSKTR